MSVSFSTTSYLLEHTMIGNNLTMPGPWMSWENPKPMSRLFFQIIYLVVKSGINVILLLAMYVHARMVYTHVSNILGNPLFSDFHDVSAVTRFPCLRYIFYRPKITKDIIFCNKNMTKGYIGQSFRKLHALFPWATVFRGPEYFTPSYVSVP